MLDIQQDVPLAGYTTLKIGGPAKYFVSVRNKEELQEAFAHAKKEDWRSCILGGGSNVFFDDRGFGGLVVRMESGGGMALDEEKRISAWAGESLSGIIGFAKENNLSGMENLVGIPGTIGGAVRGNAGAFGTSLDKFVFSAEVLDMSNGEIRIVSPADCHFSYRRSIFKENSQLVILSVVLELEKGEKGAIEEKMREVIQKRNERQPTGWVGSAGSFFENPIVEKKELVERFERESGVKTQKNKIPAGWLIENAGLKGKRIGGMEVNEKHANFVVNIGGAKAEDVVMMISYIKQQVRDELGVQLKEEVQFQGY